jgi:hypothetical protein
MNDITCVRLDNDPTVAETVNRRRFLKAVVAAGVTGFAGCSGDGDGATETPTDTEGEMDGTPTETATPTDTGGDMDGTPTDTGGDMDGTPTETATPTDTCPLPEDDPAPLVSFDGVSDGILSVSPDATTISGVITNPYLFDISSGEVTLSAPGEEWEIAGATGNTFETLESQSTQAVEWDVSVPSVASEEFELAAGVTYEACGGEATADLATTQPVFVDPYIGTEFQQLAIAPEYFDQLEEDQEAPGNLDSGELYDQLQAEVELDLSDWADAVNFQLRFGDYWPSDGWGARLRSVDVLADGETVHDVEPETDEEQEYIYSDNGSDVSQVPDANWRFADENSTWTYQFSVPEGTEELIVLIDVDNGFLIEGREGLERGSGDGM